MNKTISTQKLIMIISLPIIIICSMFIVSKTSIFLSNTNTLAFAITADLLLTLPLVYFFSIRKTNIPKTTVVPILILGIVIASIIIPNENQYYLNLFKTWFLPVIELSILTYIILKVRKAIKIHKQHSENQLDFFDTLKQTCSQILPKPLVVPFATEIAVFYYGFFNFKSYQPKLNEYTYHKTSGVFSLAIAFMLIIGIETAVLHVIIAKWSVIVAWVVSLLSIYTALQIFGIVRSLSKRPIQINENNLELRFGVLNETCIPIKEIAKIDQTSTDVEFDNNTRKLSPLVEIEGYNIVITLKSSNTLNGFYGIKKTYKTIAFKVDKPKDFLEAINSRRNHIN
ncbi:hypothetical protein [Pontimicrobium sp. IMCC45349]|uniref:hypothetical protein n=1 Tax=Pontimicrobium sp. IMCC45349 TaxID=3391574 RepID=UPI0039A35EB6